MMNRMHKGGVWCGVVLAAALWLAGCESSPSTDGVGTYFDDNPVVIELGEATGEVMMRMSPRSATLENDGAIAVITVEGGNPPYAWSVSDVSRGSIIEEGSISAVYQRSDSGDNVVICTDGRGRTGFAAIAQP